MLDLVGDVARLLYSDSSWRVAMPEILERIGLRTGADRAFLFKVHRLNDGALGQTCLYDWHAEGLAPLDPALRDLNEAFPDELMIDWAGRHIEALTRNLTGYMQRRFETERVLSFLSVPIFMGGRWWGHVGLADCTRERAWQDPEREVLRLSALLIATALERASEGLGADETARAAMLTHALDAVITIDESGTILEFNPAAERIFGAGRADMVGRPLGKTIVPPRHADQHRHGLERYLREGDGVSRIVGQRVETEAMRRDGTVFPVELSIIEIKAGRQRLFTAYLRDISERIEHRRALEQMAFRDPVTGLPNRTAILRDTSAPDDATRAVIVMQLVDFMIFNASFGQQFNDRLLNAAAIRLLGLAGELNVVARAGDDKFALLVHDSTPALELAHDVAVAMRRPLMLEGRSIEIPVVVGLARQGSDLSCNLLQDAELACYAASGEPVRIFDTTLRTMHQRRFAIELDLREALSSRSTQISAVFQPVYDLATGRLAGFEALARWRHPTRGEVPPAEFIPIAEATGLIHPLGNLMLQLAAQANAAWAAAVGHGRLRPETFFTAVNVSARQFADPLLTEKVRETMMRAGVDMRLIKLELTETTLMSNTEEGIATLRRLKQAGIRIAVDDFGTGYSSLSYIRRFPVDTIKIDRSFVTAMSRSAEDLAVVRIVIDVAHTLKLSVVAEGLEREEDVRLLKALGCEMGQGFFLGRPLTLATATRLVTDSLSPGKMPERDQGFAIEQNAVQS